VFLLLNVPYFMGLLEFENKPKRLTSFKQNIN